MRVYTKILNSCADCPNAERKDRDHAWGPFIPICLARSCAPWALPFNQDGYPAGQGVWGRIPDWCPLPKE